MALGRVNTGCGGSGGTLTVTGVTGDTVTVSKDGKTYSRTFNSSGIATFKGLKTGTWTVTMTDGTSTASRTVTIDSDYTLTITYFSATINVTYPKGSTCTATDGTTTLSAPDTSGTWACVVPNAGTWTVTATNGERTKSETVSMTAEGQTVTVELAYVLPFFISNKGMASLFTGAGNGSRSLTNEKLSALSYGPTLDIAIYKTAKVDLTSIKTLVFEGIVSKLYGDNGANMYSPRVGCWSSTPKPAAAESSPVTATYLTISSTRKEYTVDVSSLSGEYYIAITGNGIYDIYNIYGVYI